MRRMNPMALALLLALAAAALGQSPSVGKHPAPWLANARGNLFFCLNSDGSQLLVNRSPDWRKEELVVVPTSGGDGTVWHTSRYRSIYDRIGLSDDGKVLVWRSPTSLGGYETLIWRSGGGSP